MTLMIYSTVSEAVRHTHDFRNDESFKQIWKIKKKDTVTSTNITDIIN